MKSLRSVYLSAVTFAAIALVAPNVASAAAGGNAQAGVTGAMNGALGGANGSASGNATGDMSGNSANGSANGSANVTPTINTTPNGGQSASHMSATGLMNTNGPNATPPRTLGTHRAALRHKLHSTRSNLSETKSNALKTQPSSTLIPGNVNNNPMQPSKYHIEGAPGASNMSTINATGQTTAKKRSNLTNTSLPVPTPKPKE